MKKKKRAPQKTTRAPRKDAARKESARKETPQRSSRKVVDLPPWIITLYGPSGIGKTSFGAHLPEPGFLIGAKERGIKVLADYGQAPSPPQLWEVESWKDVLQTMDGIHRSGIKTLVIDSLTILEQLCFQHHCEEHFDSDWSMDGFMAFNRGPRNAARYDWPIFTQLVEDICDMGVSVLMIAHAKQKMYSNPIGPDYEMWTPTLENPTWDSLHPFCHAILFYRKYIKVEAAKGIRKGKAAPEDSGRNIYTEESPAYFAKNWMGLPAMIRGGDSPAIAASNFLEALKKAHT